jgi:hypothetical protein
MIMKSGKRKTWVFAALVGALAIYVAAQPTVAQQPPDGEPAAKPPDPDERPASRLRGELPTKPANVTVKLIDAAIPEALQAVCNQARLGLVLTGAETATDKRITLSLKKHPTAEVLELILETGGLEAEVRGGVLFVTPATETAVTDEPGPTPEPAAGADGLAEPSAVEVDGGVAEADTETVEIPIKIKTDDGEVEVNAKLKGSKDDRVQIGKSLRIEAGEEVKDVVVMGGSLEVAGHVRGDVAVIGGSIAIEPGAVVDGDVAAMGGAIDVQPGAVVHGDKASLGGPMGEVLGGLALSSMSHHELAGGLLFEMLSKLLRASILFVLALLFLSFMPARNARVREYMLRRPGYSVLAGAIMALAIAPACVLFAVTVIGIPLIPVMFLFLMALMVVGLSAFLTWLGERIPLFKDRKGPVGALAIGVVLFFLVSLIPVAGTIIVGAVAFFSAGAALLSRFGSEPKPKATATPAPATP